MSALHVAAMPFPSPQGTQAAVAAVLSALEGRDASLLTYAHGDAAIALPPVPVLRLARAFGDRSLRSGPSLPKLAEDLALALAIARHRPDVAVAHHVEAAAASLLARAPTVFVAHTALGPELPTYARRAPALLARAGDAIDVTIARRAAATVAVSPQLAARLSSLSGVDVHWLPIPWPVAPEIAPSERSEARARLGIAPDERIVLYAGNLDAYQGLPVLFDAMRALERARLVVATASRDPLPGDLSIVRVELAGEDVRRRVHAAADVAAVPRAAEGGLPIKLIDAMARGVPVAATRRATAGLDLDRAIAVTGDDAASLAAAIRALLDDRARARTLSVEARAWVARELGRERFVAVYDRAISTALRRGTREKA